MRAVVIAIVVLLLAYYIHPLFLLGLLTLLPDQDASVNVIKKRNILLTNPAYQAIQDEIRTQLTTEKLQIIFDYALFKAFGLQDGGEYYWKPKSLYGFAVQDTQLASYLNFIYENSQQHSLFGKPYIQRVTGVFGSAEKDVDLVFASMLPFIDEANGQVQETIKTHIEYLESKRLFRIFRREYNPTEFKNKAIRIFNKMMAEICYVDKYDDLSAGIIQTLTTTQPQLWMRYVGCSHETYIMSTTKPKDLGQFAYDRKLLEKCNTDEQPIIMSPNYASTFKYMWLHFKGTELSNILLVTDKLTADQCGLDLTDLIDLNTVWRKAYVGMSQPEKTQLMSNFGKHRRGLRRVCRTVGGALGTLAETSRLKKRKTVDDINNDNIQKMRNDYEKKKLDAIKDQTKYDRDYITENYPGHDETDIVDAKDTRLNRDIFPQQLRRVHIADTDLLGNGTHKVKDTFVAPLDIDFDASDFTFDPNSRARANFAPTDGVFRFFGRI